ncbi:hypothetical protein R4681_17915 [Acinetobacter baumannii]|nr:hypothetical protein [Acinetobacter baumannii]
MNILDDKVFGEILAGIATTVFGSIIFGFIGLLVGCVLNFPFFSNALSYEVDPITTACGFTLGGFVISLLVVISVIVTTKKVGE